MVKALCKDSFQQNTEMDWAIYYFSHSKVAKFCEVGVVAKSHLIETNYISISKAEDSFLVSVGTEQ